MDINGDQRDDLVANIFAQFSLHTLDELFNTLVVHTLVILHGCLASALNLLENPICFFCPHDLGRHQGEL